MTWVLLLAVWTALGAAWWIAAAILVWTAEERGPAPGPLDERRISIFKALPSPLGERELALLERGLASFAADLDGGSELLVGCHARDEEAVGRLLQRLRRAHPEARIVLVSHPDPHGRHANPKVSWMRILAQRATGELWFWSDADIQAPPGTVRSLREDFARLGVPFLTSPYLIRSATGAAAVLDTLFVNLEFYPGAVLLDRLKRIRFGFGSGMLFEAERFHRRVDWEYLGSCLADDFHLGRLLGPARLGTMRLTTVPAAEGWRDAILHYLRWQKTIRWCRPQAFAGQLAVLPLLGWLTLLALEPGRGLPWLGALAVLTLDIGAALLICRRLRCPLPLRRLPAVPLWSIVRSLTWIACWLPWPIMWRGRSWWAPRQAAPAATTPVDEVRPDLHRGSR